MWRHRRDIELPEDPWLVFGFDFVVEADQSAVSWSGAESVGGGEAAIRRHLDVLLPPRYATLWVDQELSTNVEPELIKTLSQPYEQRALHGRDYNLSSERWSHICDDLRIGSWAELCQAAYDVAADGAHHRLALDKAVEDAEKRIHSRLENVRTQLRARQSRDVAGSISAKAALDLEEALAAGSTQAVRSPRLVPDSAFAVFVSATDPFASLRS